MSRFTTASLLEEPLSIVNLLIQEHWPEKGTDTIAIVQQTFLEHFANEQVREKLIPSLQAKEEVKEGRLVRMWAVIRNNALEPEFVYAVGEDGGNHSLWRSCESDLGANLIIRAVLSVKDASAFVDFEEELKKERDGDEADVSLAYVYGKDVYELNKIYEFYGVQEDDGLHVLFSFPHSFSAQGVEFETSSEALLNYVNGVFGNKSIAVALCSRVCQRVDGLLDTVALGNLTLCLSNFNSDQKPAFLNFLKTLFPQVVDIQVNKPALEAGYLYPRVNVETGELEASLLQLIPGSCVVLDECELDAVQLNDMGTRNIGALMELVRNMTVPYDFGYSEGHFPVDVPIIVLSKSSKSLLPCALNISFNNCFTQSDIVSDISCNKLKHYVQVVRSANVIIPEELNDLIEGDFSEERVKNNAFDDKKLHVAISAARTIAAMGGLSSVGQSEWREGFELAKL